MELKRIKLNRAERLYCWYACQNKSFHSIRFFLVSAFFRVQEFHSAIETIHPQCHHFTDCTTFDEVDRLQSLKCHLNSLSYKKNEKKNQFHFLLLFCCIVSTLLFSLATSETRTAKKQTRIRHIPRSTFIYRKKNRSSRTRHKWSDAA